jgi:hypothetical protein
MKKIFLNTCILFFSLVLFTGCDYVKRREFCDCIDIGKAFEDAWKLSKKEQDEKAKACDWINEELSAQELLEEMSKCK